MVAKEQFANRISTVKPYLQYTVALLFVINAIGLFTYSIGSGSLMLAAGLLLMPKIQSVLERRGGITFQPLVLVGIIGALFLGSSALLLQTVDLSQAPDFLVPFKQ